MCLIKYIIKNKGEITERDVKIETQVIKSIQTPYYVVVDREHLVFFSFNYLEDIIDKTEIKTNEFLIKYGRVSGRLITLSLLVDSISDSNWKCLKDKVKEKVSKNLMLRMDTLISGIEICKAIYSELSQ